MILCEIGSGLGRNVEILAHLFPNATFLLFDIPPQLYVANQYLNAVFGDRVIEYKESKDLDTTNMDNLYQKIKGKIVVLPTGLITKWERFKINIFWNCASFQEMEPNIVNNYLRHIKQMKPEYIYINALPQGNYWGEWKPGQGGTREPVLEKYYYEFLEDKYNLITSYFTDYLLIKTESKTCIFEKKP
jgi:hypothetical protein